MGAKASEERSKKKLMEVAIVVYFNITSSYKKNRKWLKKRKLSNSAGCIAWCCDGEWYL